jgi:hypothetical protein
MRFSNQRSALPGCVPISSLQTQWLLHFKFSCQCFIEGYSHQQDENIMWSIYHNGLIHRLTRSSIKENEATCAPACDTLWTPSVSWGAHQTLNSAYCILLNLCPSIRYHRAAALCKWTWIRSQKASLRPDRHSNIFIALNYIKQFPVQWIDISRPT